MAQREEMRPHREGEACPVHGGAAPPPRAWQLMYRLVLVMLVLALGMLVLALGMLAHEVRR